MDNKKKELITNLAEIEFDAREKYDACRMRNHSREPEEARKQAVEYALAQAEWQQAGYDLITAKSPTESESDSRPHYGITTVKDADETEWPRE